MQIKLNRKQLFLISLGLVTLSILLFRIDYLIGGKFTSGEVIDIKIWTSGSSRYPGTYSAPIVRFNTDSAVITFQGETNVSASVGEKVSVIYQPNDSEKNLVFSFFGFWFTPILWHIIPYILLIGPAIFSFVKKDDQILIAFERRPKFIKVKGPLANEDSKKVDGADKLID